MSSFSYHIGGQPAEAVTPEKRETFQWDGLALIQRNSTNYVNEPAVTGGNPILADDKVLFNDIMIFPVCFVLISVTSEKIYKMSGAPVLTLNESFC